MALGYMLDNAGVISFERCHRSFEPGFLLHNWPPAKIFMGDVGSAFLGYTFPALPLLARHMATRAWDLLPIAAVLFVWFFLFDSAFTRLRRLLVETTSFAAHREHIFQRLVAFGVKAIDGSRYYTGLWRRFSAYRSLRSVAYREDIGLAMVRSLFILTLVLLGICVRRGVLFKRVH